MGLISKFIWYISKPLINKRKGKVGERKVSDKLEPIFFGKVEHFHIDNLILVDQRNKTHQIDHI